MLHNPDAGVPIMQRYLRCPYNNNNCLQNGCAHYDPDTQECVHVEAAQAQVQMASAMLNASSNLEQLRRWVVDKELATFRPESRTA